MEKKLSVEIRKHAEDLSAWARKQKIIKSDQEFVLALRIRKKRQEIIVRRWKLANSEWNHVFSLPLTDFQRAVLQVHRDADGRIPKSTSVPGRYHGRSVQDEGTSASQGSYWILNRLFMAAKLPFRFLWRYDKRRQADATISIARCVFPS